MSAKFVAASTQYLKKTVSPITAVPFTVGFWYNPTTAGVTATLFGIAANAADNSFQVLRDATNVFSITAEDVGGFNGSNAGTVTAGKSYFLLGRFISATNRRLAVMDSVTGAVVHVQNTVSSTPTLNNMAIGGYTGLGGPSQFENGLISELWYTNTDIQLDGLALQDATMRQLAYGGPFSLPHIVNNIIEYRSFRKTPTFDELSEVQYGASGIQTWVNNGTATTGAHPALPYWFVRPGQNKKILIV